MTVPQVTRVKAALLLGTHRSIFEAACELGDDSTPESAVMRLLLDEDGDMERYAELRDELQWPEDSLVEMLLLTEGNEEEIDHQLRAWRAQTNGLEPGGMRDYQRFLSILHAQHQHRLSKAIEARDEQDKRIAKKRAARTLYDRVGRLSKTGRL